MGVGPKDLNKRQSIKPAVLAEKFCPQNGKNEKSKKKITENFRPDVASVQKDENTQRGRNQKRPKPGFFICRFVNQPERNRDNRGLKKNQPLEADDNGKKIKDHLA